MIIHINISIIIVIIIFSTSFGSPTLQNEIINKPLNGGMYFVPNKGQWDDEVKFLTKIGGMNAWITDSGVVFDFYSIQRKNNSFNKNSKFLQRKKIDDIHEVNRYGHIIKMNIISQHETEPFYRTLEQQNTYYNYFLGNDSKRWARKVSLYGELIVENIYQDIDVRYYFDSEGLRYDLILHPEASVENIVFTIEGADDVWLNEDGELVLLTIVGEVKQKGLMAYQEINGENIEIPVEFTIDDNGNIGYAVETKDDSKPIIIDPLISSTYLGGSSWDVGRSVVVNSGNRVYVTGYTISDDFPTTPGAYHDETYDNKWNVFISSLSPDLNELYYSAILGGSSDDGGVSISFGSGGNVYVVGVTESANFPITSDVYQETLNGDQDVFISVISPDLSDLLYSTYLGGNSKDWCLDLTLDSQ